MNYYSVETHSRRVDWCGVIGNTDEVPDCCCEFNIRSNPHLGLWALVRDWRSEIADTNDRIESVLKLSLFIHSVSLLNSKHVTKCSYPCLLFDSLLGLILSPTDYHTLTFSGLVFKWPSGCSAAENHWTDLSNIPWLNLSKSTNHTEGKSQNPAEPSRARPARRYVGVSLWRSRGLRWVFFFRTCRSRDCLKKQRTVRVLLSVKWVGRLYQGALWESQWEWSRRGNDSCYLLEREQKQTAERRNMIENSDRAQLSRENCFLMVHVLQWREWTFLIQKNPPYWDFERSKWQSS